MATIIMAGPPPSGSAISANITALQNETHQIWWKARYLVDPLNAIVGGNSCPFGPDINTVNDDGAGTGQRKLGPVCLVGSSGNGALQFLVHGGNGVGNVTFDNFCMVNGGTAGLTALPANGNYIIVFFGYDTVAGNATLAIADGNGNLIVSGSTATPGAMLNSSNGFVFFCVDEFSSGALHTTVDGLAIYAGVSAPTGASRFTKPSTSDTGIVAYWAFEDASSGTTPSSATDSANAHNFTLSNHYTWSTGGLWDLSPTTTVTVTGINSTSTVGAFAISGATKTVVVTGIASSTSIGTISTSGTTNPTVTGGRVALANTTGLADSLVSHPGVAPLKALSVRWKMKADDLINLPIAQSPMAVFQIDDGTDTIGNIKCNAQFSVPVAGSLLLTFFVPGQGRCTSSTISLASLVPGTDVIGYVGLDDTNAAVLLQHAFLYQADGTLLGGQNGSLGLGNLPVATGNGRLRLNHAASAFGSGLATPFGFDIDGLAIYNQLLPTLAQRINPPSPTDTGVVAIYRFDEQAGVSTADDMGGPGLSLSNFAWESGGTWLASSHTVVSVTGIGSTSTIGGFQAQSNSVVAPITGLPSVTGVNTLSELDCTVYVAGIASTSALGALTFNTGAGPVFQQGIQTVTSIGVFSVVVTAATIPPGGPPISGVTGVQPLPPMTLAQIVQLAVAFSTANQGLNLSPTVMATRIASDQAAIFAKLAARNRSRFLRIAPVTSSNASSQRVIDLTLLPAPMQRPLQLTLADGRVVNIVDLLDTTAELAPRAYVFGSNLVEVGTDFSVVPGPVTGVLEYVQGPALLNTSSGDLTQVVSIPGDWSDVLIVPLAAYLAASDMGRSPDEVARLQTLSESRQQAFFDYCDHYAGVPALRFDIPRPLGTSR